MNYRVAAWTFGGILIVFKLWSFVLIAMYADTSGLAGFLIASHVLWIIAPVLLMIGPATFWYRMFRMRARRRDLLAQEWQVDAPSESRD